MDGVGGSSSHSWVDSIPFPQVVESDTLAGPEMEGFSGSVLIWKNNTTRE
jgi:hypothetical protein